MAGSKTTTNHSEICRSRCGTTTATTAAVPPTTTPPPRALAVSPPPSVAPPLLLPPDPPSSTPQSTAAAILTQVTSHEFEESLRESLQTEHLEEEQQNSGIDFADENVEEEEEYTNEEEDDLSAKETVPVRLSCAQKGKQKIDERSNIVDLPSEHQNIEHHSSYVPTSTTHPQLFEQSLLRKAPLQLNNPEAARFTWYPSS
ncbi:Uncharacterized protein Fot_42147 [Forsythia ovata]|uniref:Uncharacterized protein n=1 Tax=Forsythia ovata TaxID=205694 RepID=A0ABD1RKB9_9LAMI